MGYVAKHKYAPVSARKARLVIDLIRGQTVDGAMAVLRRCPQKSARFIEKVVKSAQANAEDRGANDEMFVERAWVDESFQIKRATARARGRSALIRKRRSHIVVELAAKE